MENVDWTTFFATILTAILAIVVPIIGAVVRQWIRQGIQEVKARTDATTWQTITALARTAVLAAEQSGLEQGLQQAGVQKEAAAIGWLQGQLNEKHIVVDVATLSAITKAIVMDEFNRGRAAEHSEQPAPEGTLAPSEQPVPTSPAT